jgi:hypothetical protein
LNKSTTNPRGNTRCAETTHVLQSGAAHGEIADEVPDEGSELKDGGDESEKETLELYTIRSQQEFLEEDVLPDVADGV